MNYRAVGNRCAVHLPTLVPSLPAIFAIFDGDSLLKILREQHFNVVDVDLVSLARTFIGDCNYRLGATMEESPKVIDCSSFTKYLYAQKGIWLPRLSIQQRQKGISVEVPSPGDLVFTTGYRNFYEIDPQENIGHVGIATGEGTVIHATNVKGGVIESTWEEFNRGEPRGIRRIVLHGTITLEKANKYLLIETADDFRWISLKNTP